MLSDHQIWLADPESAPVLLDPAMANRHGLIAGATGTGKTVTLKVLAEAFSELGVPVFLCDVKGDLSGMCDKGTDSASMRARIERFGLKEFTFRAYPSRFFDVFGESGCPVRTTVSEMGPLLLSRLMELNETQSGVLRIVFRIADDKGLLLLDLKDLRSMLNYVGENASEYTLEYGNIAAQSLGAIQRKLLALEDQGAALFFGEPALDIFDWMQTENGQGVINILDCKRLINSPMLYGAFLLWLLSELFERLPEAGDLPKPKMVFFFEEASLIFDGASKTLLQKIEQTVKLIRSKGVGIYFVTQSPSDIPDAVLAQLGNRVQHALRAYTPKEQLAVRAAASSFRTNPDFDTEQVITELGVGEALVSFLDAQGRPEIVRRAFILPPQSSMRPADEAVRAQALLDNPLNAKYAQEIDRESAYEILVQRVKSAQREEAQAAAEKKTTKGKAASSRKKKTLTERAVDKAVDSFGRAIGKGLYRGLLGLIKL